MLHRSTWDHPNLRSIVYLGLGLLICAVVLFWLGPAPAQAQGSCPNPYTVQSGDYWTRIARQCGVTLQALYNANQDLRNRRGDNIRVGDQVRIPSSTQPPTNMPTPRPSPTPAQATPSTQQNYAFYYTVKRGDTWSQIAAGHQIPLETLYAYNGVWVEHYGDRRRIEPGDNILIPGRNGETIIPRGSTYTFRSGDTLFRIGQRTGYSLAVLEAANPSAWTNRNLIRPGTRIVIPASAGSTGPVTPTVPTAVGGQPCRANNTPYPTNITVGDMIEVVSFGPNTLPNIVYDPLGSRGARTRVGTLPAGATAQVVLGPRCDAGMIWWYVIGESVQGWTSEGEIKDGRVVYWLQPLYGQGSSWNSPIEEITLRPGCGDTFTVSRDALIVLSSAWGVKGYSLAAYHDEIMDVEIYLDGELLPSYRSDLRPMSAIPCGSRLTTDTYWVTEIADTFLAPGRYTVNVRFYFSERVTDGFDLNRDGQLDYYGPGYLDMSSRIYTLIVR